MVLERSIVNQFGSEEECGMFVIVLEKDLQLAKGVIGTARVEIMKSDQPAKVMSVIQAYEKPDDRKTLDGFVENYVVPYRKKLATKPQHTLAAQLPKASFKAAAAGRI